MSGTITGSVDPQAVVDALKDYFREHGQWLDQWKRQTRTARRARERRQWWKVNP